jgi:hypothetical protein
MATWEEVGMIADGLPDVEAGPGRTWNVRAKTFALERPLRRADLEFLGPATPGDPPLAVWVPDRGVKEALLARSPSCFTTPHFNGYPMVLVRLDRIEVDELAELVTDSWLTRAPRRLARQWLDEHPDGGGALGADA